MSQIPDEVLSFSMLFGSKQHREYQEIVLCKWLNPSFGSRVGGQNNVIFSRRIYLKIELSSQRREMLFFQPAIRRFLFWRGKIPSPPKKSPERRLLLVLTTNMAAWRHVQTSNYNIISRQTAVHILGLSSCFRSCFVFFYNFLNCFRTKRTPFCSTVIKTTLKLWEHRFSVLVLPLITPPPPGLLSMCYCLLFVFLRVIIVTTQVEWTFLIWILQ